MFFNSVLFFLRKIIDPKGSPNMSINWRISMIEEKDLPKVANEMLGRALKFDKLISKND